jgi:D-alanyl-D-alanine carboxypeptidase
LLSRCKQADTQRLGNQKERDVAVDVDVETPVNDTRSLCACVRHLWIQFRGECERSGVPVTLIETLRSPERQRYCIEAGVSLRRTTRHLQQPPKGRALAFDACPTEYLRLKFWNVRGIYWQRLGVIARDVGLEWGGHWRFKDGWKDSSHFELRVCACEAGHA